MATSHTFGSLTNFIKGMIEDSGSDFSGRINDIVMMAEDRCLIDLNLTIFDRPGVVTLSSGDPLANLPENFIKLRTLSYLSGGVRRFMEQRSHEYAMYFWPSSVLRSNPIFWAPYSETQIYIAPTPESAIACDAFGIKRPTSLVVDQAGTWLSKNAGSLLAKACLIVSEQWDVDDARAGLWKADYEQDLAAKRMEFRHLIRREYDRAQ